MKKLSFLVAKVSVLSFFMMMLVAPVILVSASDANAQATNTNNQNTLTTGSTVVGNANDNTLVNVMCNVMQLVTGNAGKAFAAFAIISLGIGFFTGKVSWGLMVGVALGIAAMFGATTIVAAITGDDAFDCTL